MANPSAPADVRHLVTELIGSVPNGWRRLIASITLAIMATGASVALMGVSGWLISRAAEHPPVLFLQVAAVGVRFFGTSRGIFRYVERLFGHDLALRMQGSLRLRTYDKLSRTTLLGRRQGDLLMRATADVEAIMDVIVRVVLPFCSASVVLLGTSLMLTMFSPASAAVLLGTSILAGLGFPWLSKRLSNAVDADAIEARGELADRVHEIAHAAPDLLAYQATDLAVNRLLSVDERLRRAEARAAWTRGVAAAGQLIAAGMAVVAALVIGGQAVASGDMLARNLAVLCLTPLALHEAFADLTKASQTLTRARSALARIVALLGEDAVGQGDRPTASEAPADLPADAVVLEADDMAIGWPDAPLVAQGIDLTMRKGEKVAVVGPSGIGKTTLAATILGLIPAAAGELIAPEHISYLAQDAHIFATTLSENVRIGNRSATPEQVAEALTMAGLDLDPGRIVAEAGSTLSGGEARRVALARVLVAEHSPSLVILDEPTEHLDHDTAEALMADTFRALEGVAVLVITHDPEVMHQCDRIVELTPAGIR